MLIDQVLRSIAARMGVLIYNLGRFQDLFHHSFGDLAIIYMVRTRN